MTEPNAELLATIEVYHELGLAVIPFYIAQDGKKRPKIDAWQKWKTERQTDEEVKAVIPDILATQLFGVVTGTKINLDGEEYYFTVVDRDIKDPEISEETKQKSKKAIALMPTTRTIATINKGEHLEYYSRTQVSGKKPKGTGLELLGYGQLCVMYPSKGYTKINDNIPTVIDNAEDMFLDTIEQVGLAPHRYKQATAKATGTTPKQYKRRPFRPCFKKLIQKAHLEHLEKVALVYEMHYCGVLDQEVYDIFHENKAWEPSPEHNYKEQETDAQIKFTLEKASSLEYGRYKKETLQDLQICLGNECPLFGMADCRKSKHEKSDETVNPIADLAKPIEQKHKFAVDEKTALLYVYDEQKGVWYSGPATEHLISQEICNMLDDKTRIKYYKDVENWITHNEKTPRVSFNPDNNLVAFKNGVLNIATGEVLAPKPEYYLTTKIPHNYNKAAKMDIFPNFLAEMMPNENHRKQLQEILGKTLARKNRIYHTILILCGEGNNGKSVLLDFIGAWIGKENICHVIIQALATDKFERVAIKDKIANICADLPSELLKHIGTVLRISAGDPVQLQEKYGAAFEYEPNISLMFACNEAPAIDSSQDHTGTYRRIILIECPVIFTPPTPENPNPEHKEDKTLRERLCANENEFEGFTNWIYDGYLRLKKQCDLTARPTVPETRLAYIKRSNSPHAFVLDNLTDSGEFEDILFDDPLFRDYINYCIEKKLTRKSKGELTKAIKQYTPGAEHTKAPVSSDKKADRKPCWRYLRKKTDAEKTNSQKTGNDKTKITGYTEETTPDSVRVVQPVRPVSETSENVENKNSEKNKLVESGRTTGTSRTICYRDCIYFDKKPCKHYGNLNQVDEKPKDCTDFIAKTDTSSRIEAAYQRILTANKAGDPATNVLIGDPEAVRSLLKDSRIFEDAAGNFRTTEAHAALPLDEPQVEGF